MFTGIVEEMGTVRLLRRGAKSAVLSVSAATVLEDLKIGDSVAVNGVCLTVTDYDCNGFTADVMPETLTRSSLGCLNVRSVVNLERAMPLNGRFGGHIVSGHIDGTGTIKETHQDDNACWFTIQAAPALLHYIVEKGSITVDGISLTVASVTEDRFSVSLIPHTYKMTVLGYKHTGDIVNLEIDMIAKYIEKLMQPRSSGNITKEFLEKYDF